MRALDPQRLLETTLYVLEALEANILFPVSGCHYQSFYCRSHLGATFGPVYFRVEQ